VDLGGGVVELTELSVEIRSLVSGGHFIKYRPLKVAEFANLSELTTISPHPFEVGSDMVIAGTYHWQGGELRGPNGQTGANGPILMTSLTNKVVTGRTLVCNGPVLWMDTGNIRLDEGAVLDSRVSFAFKNNQVLGGNGGTFINRGPFRKFDSQGQTLLVQALYFENTDSGSIIVETGLLRIDGPGESRGAVSVSDGATIRFSGASNAPFSFRTFTDIGGEGLIWSSGQNLTADVNGIVAMKNLLVTGRLRGPGNFLPRNMTWTSGTLDDAGTTEVAEILTISGALTKVISNHNLFNDGEATWTGAGTLSIQNGGALINTSTLTIQDETKGLGFDNDPQSRLVNSGGDSLLSIRANTNLVATGSGPRVENGGTIDITNNATADFQVALKQDGRVNVTDGLAIIRGGGENSGVFDVSADGLLDFRSGTYTLKEGSTFSGDGLVGVSGGATVVAIEAAEVDIPKLELIGGQIAGPGTLRVTDVFGWTGGKFAGPGITESRGRMSISSNSSKSLSDCFVSNVGEATWTDNGSIALSNEAVLVNEGGFDIQNNATVQVTGLGNRILNLGTIRKSAGGGETHVQAELANTGTIDVTSGSLRLTGGGTSTGTFQVEAGSVVLIAARAYSFEQGAKMIGAGATRVSSGAAVINGQTVEAENFEFAGGTLQGPGGLAVNGVLKWSGGTMSDAGNTLIRKGGAMPITGNTLKVCSRRTIRNEGSANLAGGDLVLNDGALWHNLGAFDVVAPAGFQNQSGDDGSFLNEGQFHKTGGETTAFTAGAVFINLGSVGVEAGSLNLASGGRNLGRVTIAEGAAVQFLSQPYTLDEGTRISGPGQARCLYEVVLADEDPEVENFLLKGTLKGPGNLKVTGAFEWETGDIAGPAGAIVRSEDALNIAGAGSKRVLGRTFVSAGEGKAAGVSVALNDGAVWENSGRLTLEDHNGFARQFGDTGTFNNTGILVKNSPDRASRFFSGVEFNNLASGVVNVIAGDLQVSGGGSSKGSFFLADDRRVLFDADYTFDGGCRFVGAGAPWVQDGALVTLAGPVEAQNFILTGRMDGPGELRVTENLAWSNGTMSGSGDTIVEGELTMRGEVLNLRRTLRSLGRADWSFGSINMTDVALDNRGTFTARREEFGGLRFTGFGVAQFINRNLFKSELKSLEQSVEMDVNFVNSGTVEVVRGRLVFGKEFTQTSGAVRVMRDGVIEFTRPVRFVGGTIGVDSEMNVARLTNEGGVLKPGQSPGVFKLVGDFEQLAGGSIEIELAGYTPGDEYDVLAVTGDAMLGGKLDIRLLDGFEPQVGDTFNVMTYGSGSGEFARVLQPCGFEFAVHYNANDVTLQVTGVGVPTPGDLDGDCDVDLDDYRRFAPCIGGPGVDVPPQGCDPDDFAAADADGDRDVDIADAAAFGNRFTGD